MLVVLNKQKMPLTPLVKTVHRCCEQFSVGTPSFPDHHTEGNVNLQMKIVTVNMRPYFFFLQRLCSIATPRTLLYTIFAYLHHTKHHCYAFRLQVVDL